MLVLSRQRDQTIVIGEGVNRVVLTLVDIRGDKVRIGIDAAKEIQVSRGELLATEAGRRIPKEHHE